MGSPFERAMLVSYRLFIVTIAPSVGRNLLSNVCDAQINSPGWVTLGQTFKVFPLE